MINNFLRKVLKKDKLIVKKTDNELVRYIKQTTIIEERKRYEELMKQEEDKKKRGLNDKEKRQLYFNTIDSIPRHVYDKAYINDNLVDYSYLHDPESYKLVPSHKRRWFFLKPFYAKQSDFSEKVSARVWATRIIGSLLLLKAGYEFGVWDGEYLNKQLKKSVVVEFETEEQIYDYLFNKNMTAVFL